ncbi:hypothetical protein VTI28DRAFT_7501 [Corynascus sepedonium]
MESLGFTALSSDLCLFRHKEFGALVVLYVDDLLIATFKVDIINGIRDRLRAIYDLKELGEWLEERADVDDYIQAAVRDLKVWKRLEGLGWDTFDIDPKKTFDKLTQYFEDDTLNSQSKMIREFSNIRRDMFASIDAF